MGVSFIRTVTAPAADFDLTTLAIVKDELNIPTVDTGNDAWLARAISQISEVCSNYCNRVFVPQAYEETQYIDQDPYPYQVPGGVGPLQLSRWPLIEVVSVKQNYPIKLGTTLTVGTNYAVDLEKGQLIRLNAFTGVAVEWEALPTVIEYSAGYGSLIAETATVPASPGPYTVTVGQASQFSYDDGVTYLDGTPFVLVSGSPASAGQYAVNPATGVYTFNSADQGVTVVTAYAYCVIPNDLVDAVLRTITARYKAKNRDPALMSQEQPNLGSQRFWLDKSSLPPEITQILDNYRVPVVG